MFTSDMQLDEKDFAILDDKYILIKKIGTGATCKVKLAKVKETNEIVAVKILTPQPGRTNIPNKHFVQEVEMLKKINHLNIINLKDGNKGIVKKPDGRSKMVDYIVLDFASNGELFDYIYFPRKGLGEGIGRLIFKQLIEGLEGCHNAGVVHRDLKTENIMMNDKWILKIADFGYATLLAGKTGNNTLTSFLGTLSYAAPEILNKKPYNGVFADIFSCGVILFVLVTGKLPFGKAVIHDSYYKFFGKNDYAGYWAAMTPKCGELSEDLKNLINAMLTFDPTGRPSISEIKAHPWFNKEAPTYMDYVKDFEERKKIVTECKELEAQEEERKKKKGGYGGVYRGEGDVDSSEELLFLEERTPLIDARNLNTPYKIKLQGDNYMSHLNYLANYFRKEDTREKSITPHEEMAKFRVEYETDKEILESLPDLEIEKLTFDVEIEKTEDSYIAVFTKIAGDKLEFFNVYDELINFSQKAKI
jgi:serine/threonine protein kinase